MVYEATQAMLNKNSNMSQSDADIAGIVAGKMEGETAADLAAAKLGLGSGGVIVNNEKVSETATTATD